MISKLRIFVGISLTLSLISTRILAQLPDQITAGDAVVLQMPEISLIDTDHAPVTLTLTTSIAGESVAASVSNSDMWIKITSVVPGNTHREIKAKIVGTVPPGTTLSILPTDATLTNSAGNLGDAVVSPITLTSTDQNIITNIGSCYTGTGSTDGYQLTYTWSLDNPTANFGLLEANSGTSVTVYLTLTQSNNNGY
ncbi:MAG: hypothetical protein HN704_04945 [Bacteroidetes bacterium]|jgi:hypothetical protein|nr:hypothetical protein [Bacteroidota bacterium]MBT6688121.1 hypothetical protein [Bacteroidota bacterium]MBT7143552.1 hypothetical protein [Bacteroidota bacterium]MBT7490939.1 hypothetical protein [Bacteroidota bacterium]